MYATPSSPPLPSPSLTSPHLISPHLVLSPPPPLLSLLPLLLTFSPGSRVESFDVRPLEPERAKPSPVPLLVGLVPLCGSCPFLNLMEDKGALGVLLLRTELARPMREEPLLTVKLHLLALNDFVRRSKGVGSYKKDIEHICKELLY